MSGSFDAQNVSIGSLLGRYERRPVVLPEFQRSYSWEKSQVTTFWDDLMSFHHTYSASPVDASYFLGPIVILDDKQQITLLDGQQRLATATILLAALRDTARGLDKATSAKGADFARDIQRELLEKDTDPITYSLTLNRLDKPFFEKTIQHDPPENAKVSLRSHNLIKNAYEIFLAEARGLIVGKPPTEALKLLKTFQDALTKGMALVAITVQTEEDAYAIFETLNDRGLRLSVPDLVVNLLMRRCPDDKSRHSVRDKWDAIIQQMGRRDVSRFLRHMWLSRYGDVKSKGLFAEIKTNLEGKKVSSLEFAESCASECEDYVKLLEADSSLPLASINSVQGLVSYLGVNNALPLLLSGYRCLTEADFERLLRLTLSVYIRHTLLTNQNPLELETAFYDAAREIRAQHASSATSARCFQAGRKILVVFNPTDSAVIVKAKELELTRSEAVWLMTQLANEMQSKTKEIRMDKANLEHIFPQKAGADWPNRADLEPYLWHLGNLTILGHRLNNKAQNKSFKTKCSEYYSKSEIEMTKDVLKYKNWDQATVDNRAEEMGKLIVQVWP